MAAPKSIGLYASATHGNMAPADMHDTHLANAIAKLTKSRADPASLSLLNAEQVRRTRRSF